MLAPFFRLFSSLWNFVFSSIEDHYKKLGEKTREEPHTKPQDESKINN
jgi:hypothetical protein